MTNNLPAFEQAVTELFRSELEKYLNEILAYELTAFLDYEPYARTDKQIPEMDLIKENPIQKMVLLRSIFQEIEWENSLLLFYLNTEDVIYLLNPLFQADHFKHRGQGPGIRRFFPK